MKEVLLRRIASVVAGQSPPAEDVSDLSDELPFIQGNAEFTDQGPRPRLQCSTAPKRALAGDLLLSVRAPVGAMNWCHTNLGIGRGVAALRPVEDWDRRFLAYSISARMPELQSLATGSTFDAVTSEALGSLVLPEVSSDQQRRIANFLDDRVAQIDNLATARHQQMRLLHEAAAARVSRAVTKAEPNWAVGPVRRFLTSEDAKRIPLSSEERSTRQGDYPYYGASGVIDQVDDYLFDSPRVLVSEDGANLLARSSPISFVAHGRYWVNNHAHILQTADDAHDFWAARIEAVNVSPWVTGSAQPKLTVDAVMSIPVSAPPNARDRHALGEEVVRIRTGEESQMGALRRSISLLTEYKSSLITAAVNGEIDVTTAGSGIPG